MDYNIIIIVLMMIINLYFAMKPNYPILNIIFGLFLVVFGVAYNSSLPFQPFFLMMLIIIAIFSISISITAMMKRK